MYFAKVALNTYSGFGLNGTLKPSLIGGKLLAVSQSSLGNKSETGVPGNILLNR